MTGATTTVEALSGSRDLNGPRLWALRWAWLLVVVASLVVTVAGFDAFLAGDRPLIADQGPLSVQPDLARQLQFRLFDQEVIKTGQVATHLAGIVLFGAAGIFIFARRSRDWMVALSSMALLLAGTALFVPSNLLASRNDSWSALVETIGAFDAGPEFWRSLAGLALMLFALLFPDGRFVPRWTRWLAVGFGAWIAAWALFPGVPILDVSAWPDGLKPAWTLGLAIATVYAQIHRYVTEPDRESRKQTRLVVISLTAVVGSFLLIWLLDPGLSSTVDFGLVLVTDRTQTIFDLNLLSVLTFGVIVFPISIGISVARYRLWDMDLVINRALVYGSVTVVLGLVLATAVAVISGLVDNSAGRQVGIGLSAVVTAAAFQPLRLRLQSAIDRRFYPDKYDAERALEALAAGIRDEIDLEALRSQILGAIDETLRPAAAHLALPGLDPAFDADHRALGHVYVAEANQPIGTSSDLLPPGTAAPLTMRGISLVVPLVSHGELTAVLELGNPPSGRTYGALDLQLLRRLAHDTAPVIRYAELVAREAEERAARQAYEQELRLAEKIQRDLLPRELPDIDGWELGARYQPARQVSGDLYDFITLGDGRLAIVIADVTDKGVPAAMVMATCRSVLRAAAGTGRPSPGEILARVNTLLLPDIPENMFVTCFFAVLDPSTGDVRFANAGQNLPFLKSGGAVTELRARGMPLGLMPDMDYEEDEVRLEPGDGVLFYSDGLIEAHDPSGEMFGKDRAIDRVRNHPGGPGLLDYLVESLIGFAGADGARDDDVTLVSLRRLPAAAAPHGTDVVAEFSASSERGGELDVADRVIDAIELLRLPDRMIDRIRTAVSEAAMNAMEHGNGYDPDLAVEVRVRHRPGTVEVHLTDQGPGPSPGDAVVPDLDAKLAGEQSPRGWGLFLIKNMADDVRVVDDAGRHRIELAFSTEEPA